MLGTAGSFDGALTANYLPVIQQPVAFDPVDRTVLFAFAALLAAITVPSFSGLIQLWVPPLLVGLAR